MPTESKHERVLRKLIEENGLLNCVQCGKCSSACTMVEIFEDFAYPWAPRMIIEDALSGIDVLRSPRTWSCLTCHICEHTCPSGVRFRDFIDALRKLAEETGYTRHLRRCKSCGALLLPHHTLKYVQAKTQEHLPESALLCMRCKRRIIVGRFKESIRRVRRR